MYLSQLILNPRSRQVQSELARPYQMHKTLMKAFPSELPPDERVLFRLEEDARTGLIVLLVQSKYPPDWSCLHHKHQYLLPEEGLPPHIATNPATKHVDLHLHSGQILAFRLHANPTRKLKVDGKKNGRRIEIYKENELQAWIARKLESAGGRLRSFRIAQSGKIKAYQTHNDYKNTLTLFGVRFDGTLEVVDPSALLHAVNNGVGSGKGLGFGLLSLAPVRG